MVLVHLTGKYEGRIFEDRDVTFTIGEGSEQKVIDGVERAVEKMKKGETSRIILKPQYAFASKGSEEFGIPPNATIEYIVTLKNFEKVLINALEKM